MYWPERYRTQLLVCSATKSGFDNGIAAECIQKQPQQMRSRSRAIHSTQTSDPSIYFPPKTERSLHGFRVFFSCLITQASLHPLCHGQWSCWRCSDPQSGGEELEAPSAEGWGADPFPVLLWVRFCLQTSQKRALKPPGLPPLIMAFIYLFLHPQSHRSTLTVRDGLGQSRTAQVITNIYIFYY